MKLYIRLFILALLTGLLAFGCGGPDAQDQAKLKQLVVATFR